MCKHFGYLISLFVKLDVAWMFVQSTDKKIIQKKSQLSCSMSRNVYQNVNTLSNSHIPSNFPIWRIVRCTIYACRRNSRKIKLLKLCFRIKNIIKSLNCPYRNSKSPVPLRRLIGFITSSRRLTHFPQRQITNIS